MRRQPTEEQKAKAAERRERFRQLVKMVAAMSEDERTALVMKCGAIVTCEGRALSPLNSCLVLTQFPTASMVGGFLQWKAHGRSVKKGEHGLSIWVPTGRKEEREELKEAIDEGERKRAGFIMGTVFDVSQTEPSNERIACELQTT
jgi:N-terminal domain of anti-restriction factor ArdC